MRLLIRNETFLNADVLPIYHTKNFRAHVYPTCNVFDLILAIVGWDLSPELILLTHFGPK